MSQIKHFKVWDIYMSSGVYIPGGGGCPGDKCQGGIILCPWGKCLGGTCPGDIFLLWHWWRLGRGQPGTDDPKLYLQRVRSVHAPQRGEICLLEKKSIAYEYSIMGAGRSMVGASQMKVTLLYVHR